MISRKLLSTGRNNETSHEAGFLNWSKWVESRKFLGVPLSFLSKISFSHYCVFILLYFLFSFIGSSYLRTPTHLWFYTFMSSSSSRGTEKSVILIIDILNVIIFQGIISSLSFFYSSNMCSSKASYTTMNASFCIFYL